MRLVTKNPQRRDAFADSRTNQRGPGHYVCGPLEGGQPEEVLPHIGWVNVMPAVDAEVDVTVLGQKLHFPAMDIMTRYVPMHQSPFVGCKSV